MAAGAAAGAAAAIANAIKASGVLIRVEPEEFSKLLNGPRIRGLCLRQTEFSKKAITG